MSEKIAAFERSIVWRGHFHTECLLLFPNNVIFVAKTNVVVKLQFLYNLKTAQKLYLNIF